MTDRRATPPGGTPPEAGAARAARLEARLAVYAHYAAVVAEQAAAAAGGDADRAEALAAERERVAEHFAELQDATAADAGFSHAGAWPTAGAPSFRAALDEALAELAHQGAVDVALAQRLVSLREAVVRGAAWATGGGVPATPRALPAPAVGAPLADRSPQTSPARVSPDRASLDNALVAARAAQVGGALGGQYPGRGTRDEWPAGWGATEALTGHGGAPTPAAPARPRLDVRF